MSLFACAIRPDGGHVSDSFRAAIEASPFCRRGEVRWHAARGFLGAVGGDGIGMPSIVRLGPVVAIGSCRLDNRTDVLRWCSAHEDGASDLALAVRYVTRDLGARAGRLLGDFAFVVWDPTCRTVVAVRDTFGVRKLFHTGTQDEVMAFASHASLLASGDCYDLQFLVDRVAQCGSDLPRTVYAGVSTLPPASILRVYRGKSDVVRYWSAESAQATGGLARTADDLCDAFRSLLIEAVRVRLSDGDTWSHLSGGLDSSSVVSIAQWMARRGDIEHGLAGTVTYTDSRGTSADEREYSDAVVREYGVRNDLVPHRGDAGELQRDPPLLDQPNVPFTMALRDRAAGQLVRREKGRVLLTGEGGDSLVAGTMFFFADWMVSGRIREALREMAHRAALGRVSFWKLAYENALLPVLPRFVRRPLTRTRLGSIPPWIPPALTRRFAVASRSMLDEAYGGRRGRKYADAAASVVEMIPYSLPLGPLEQLVDLRHPYLHRPLVELALRLPAELCVRPHARKWILREAMRGILPEKVRTRVGKGALDGLNVWSLVHGGRRIERLLRDPILAQLGCIDRTTLQRIFDDVRSGRASHEGWRDLVNSTLDVEMWLQLRDGRWAATGPQSTCSTNVALA